MWEAGFAVSANGSLFTGISSESTVSADEIASIQDNPLVSYANTVFTYSESVLSNKVFDEDQTPESQALVSYLGKHHNLVSVKQEQNTILDMLYDERIDYAMTIAKGYAENLHSGHLNNNG